MITPLCPRAARAVPDLRSVLLIFALVFSWMPLRADGPGITQQTFTAGQVHTVIHTFPESEIGASITIAEFQHGYLYTGSGGAGQPFRSDNWYNILDPDNPVLVERQARLGGDKPHSIGFWGDNFTSVTNGVYGRVMNFDTRQVLATHPGTVNSIWDSVQAPYVFSGSHGYAAEASRIEVFDFSDPATPVVIKSINTATGFKIGSLHAIGNLLIVSGNEGVGAGVYDISDPLNPQLLSAKTTGGQIYTSLIYGSRLFNCEKTSGLVRVWDFSNPNDIVDVGTVNVGGNARYIAFQDGKAHIAPTNGQYFIFNPQTLAIEQSFAVPPAPAHPEFSYPFSNLAILGGDTSASRAVMVMAEAPDTTGPSVVYLNPGNGATGVPVTARIGLSMSDSIDIRSLDTTNFIVRPAGGSAIAGTYSTQMGVISFTPAAALQPATVYQIVLAAGGVKDVVGNGLATAFSASFTTSATGGTAPAAPTGLTVAVNSTAQSTLSWTRNSTNEYKVIIERKTGAGAFAPVGAAGNGETGFKDFGLQPGTSYTYRVRAVNPFGMSAYSNESSVVSVAGLRMQFEAMTLDANVEIGRLNYSSGGAYTMIASGTSGSATAAFTGATGTYDLAVAYFDENDGPGSYQLQRNGVSISSWTANAATACGVASPTNAAIRQIPGISLTNGDTIKLVMTLGSGAAADRAPADYIDFVSVSGGLPVKATTPTPSNNATSVATTTNLSWSNGGGATSYDVYFGTASTPGAGQFIGNQAPTTYTPSSLAAATQYWWRIDARNATGVTTGDVWTFTTAAAPASDLIAFYRFDDAAGSGTVIDHTGSFAGTTSGVTLQPGSGQIAGDVLFPNAGTSGYVSLPAGVLNGRTALTTSFWMKSSNTGQQAIISGANGTTNEFLLLLYTDTQVDLWVHNVRYSWTGLADLTDGQFHHVTLVLDGVTDQATLYVDNDSKGTISVTLTALSIASGGLILGQEQDSVGGGFDATQDFDGELDHLKFFNRALSAAEVGSVYGETNAAPVIDTATSSANPTAVVSTSVSFAITAHDLDGETLQYEFDYGDGQTRAFSTTSTAAHTYTTPGHYNVTFKVKDPFTQAAQVKTIVVHTALTATPPTRSSSIAYDASRNEVWCVNPDSNTITCLNALTGQKQHEVATLATPRFLAIRPDATEVWVTCEEAGKIQVFNADTAALVTTMDRHPGSHPLGIAFAPNGGAVFVVEKGTDTLIRFNPGTALSSTPRSVADSGAIAPNSRSVAVSGDSAKVYVARFISAATDPLADFGEVRVLSAATLDPSATIQLPFETTADTENSGRGVPNYLLDVTIAPDGARAWVASKKDNTARGFFGDDLPLGTENTVRSNISQLNLSTNQEVMASRKDVNDRSLLSAVVFSPVGDLVFVSFLLNNEVRVFNVYTGNDVAGAPVGAAPLGMTINPAGTRLYVHNFLDRTVTIFDTTNLVNGTGSSFGIPVGTFSTVATELLAADVLAGKKLFYNASDERMSLLGYQSCAACHLEGSQDGRIWDFGDRGEGLRNTGSMEGRQGMGHGLVHWSGNFDEIQDFEHDIRGSIVDGVRTGFGGSGFMTDTQFNTGTRNQPLGDAKAGVSANLDALAAYVSSLDKYPASPHRTSGGSLTTSAINGRQIFDILSCQACHNGPRYTDSTTTAPFMRHDVGTLKATSGARLGGKLDGIDTPTLRSLWATAPYLHDGSAPTLSDVFNNATNAPDGSPHAAYRGLTSTEQTELLDFLLQIDGTEPEVSIAAPVKASTPAPANNATGVSQATGLFWANGGRATNYAVYFGTDSTPDSSELQGAQGLLSFSPPPLSANTQYWWRIDARNGTGTTTGDVWTFTTGTTGVTNLAYLKTVTSSSSLEDSNWGAADSVNGNRNSVSGAFGWTSHSNLTADHTEWVRVDLGANYSVSRVDLYPRNDGAYVGLYFPRDFIIETSLDGSTWSTKVTKVNYPLPDNAVQTFTFPTTTVRYIRVTGTKLRYFTAFRMQFAEIEVY